MHTNLQRKSAYAPRSNIHPRGLELQISALVEAFPELALAAAAAHNYIRTRLPTILHFGATGWYVAPERALLASDYLAGVRRVNAALDKFRGCRTWEDRNPRYMQPEPRTVDALGRIAQQQGGGFLFLQAQPGNFHINRSTTEIRGDYLRKEFGLGTIEVGCMLIANPELLVMENDPIISCPGDTCNVGQGPDSISSPCYLVDSETTIEISSRIIDHASPKMGAATAFE